MCVIKSDKECWEDLCNAIIVRAADDYRQYAKDIKKLRFSKRIDKEAQKERLMREIRQTERFFTSGFFQILTQVDGKKMLNLLRKENW